MSHFIVEINVYNRGATMSIYGVALINQKIFFAKISRNKIVKRLLLF